MKKDGTLEHVNSNQKKYVAYRTHLLRYKRAMKEAFYFEAIMIDYAMIEDRTTAFLYYMGLIADRRSKKIRKRSYDWIMRVVEKYKKENEKQTIGIRSLEGKLKIIRCVLQWASQEENETSGDHYLQVLKAQIESIDIGLLLETLEGIEEWKGYRNKVVHELFANNVGNLEVELADKAERGMIYARILDNQERILKKGNRIRKSAKL